jgi:glucose-1-phosphate thymidylyltransferase
MKGIILTAGKGTRLYPACQVVNKQLIPVYDKPLIYYSLAVLMQANIRDILIICNEKDIASFQMLLGNGAKFGIHISYTVQKIQRGIADAFLLGKDFVGKDSVCLILGDNIFIGDDFNGKVKQCSELREGAVVFGLPSDNPAQFGVVEFDAAGNVLSIEEKPKAPKSNYIVPGLYFYDYHAPEIAGKISPSARGELEITEVNNVYLRDKKLKIMPLSKDTVWFDAGTPDRILAASLKVKQLQAETDTVIACIEEIAYRQGWITYETMRELAAPLQNSDYGKYILSLPQL